MMDLVKMSVKLWGREVGAFCRTLSVVYQRTEDLIAVVPVEVRLSAVSMPPESSTGEKGCLERLAPLPFGSKVFSMAPCFFWENYPP